MRRAGQNHPPEVHTRLVARDNVPARGVQPKQDKFILTTRPPVSIQLAAGLLSSYIRCIRREKWILRAANSVSICQQMACEHHARLV